MPLFSAVLNLFAVGGSSPSEQDNETPKSRRSQPPCRSSNLLQKLNRRDENSAILDNARLSPTQESYNSSKKRTRADLSSDDEENDVLTSQKRRRVYVSASDDWDDTTRVAGSDNDRSSIVSDTRDTENSTTNGAHYSELELEANTGTEVNSENKNQAKYSKNETPRSKYYPCNDVVLYNEKDVGTCRSDTFLNTNSGKSLEVNKPNTAEAEKDEDLSSSNDLHVETKGMLSAVVETHVEKKVLSKSSTSVREEMECSAEASKDEKQEIVRPTSSDDEGIDNAGDYQLVPDVTSNKIQNTITNDDQEVAKEEEKEDVGLDDDQGTKDTSGDQVVDENDNDVKPSEEEEENALLAKQVSEGSLTDAMLDQEKKLHEEHMDEEKAIVDKAMEEWQTTAEQQRYSRLQHLLQKSNVYSSFLLQRIEEQKIDNEKKKLRDEKKAEKTKKDKESLQTVPETKRGRKSQKKSTGYNITDYVDTEALKKNSKESIAVPCMSDKDDCKTFSIGNHTKQSNNSQIPGYVTPKLFTGGALRDYQIEGVEWLKVLYENGVNGILADEMGLGKTVQCIAVIAHLIEHGVRGPFLITAPLSTLPNWAAEFKRFAPGIFAVVYHGTPEERTVLRKKFSKLHGDKLKSFPVAITSYDIIMNDRKHLVKYMWKYLIVDEGHRIKNLKCRLIRELKAFPTANRLLLTGTPLQNNLAELWSLLNFLLPDIFNDLDSFQAWFDFSAISESGGNEKIIAQEREHHVLERLHAILTPFLLRRLKSDVSIDVPRKKEVFVYAPLTQKQKHWYQLLLDKSGFLNYVKSEKEAEPSFTPSGRKRRSCYRRTSYDIFDNDGISYDEMAEILAEEDEKRRDTKQTVASPLNCERHVTTLNIMMMLRKACNHPYLLEYPLVPETQDYRIDEEVITSCGKTLVLDQMLAELISRGHKVLLFSQMTKLLDILEDFCYLRKYKFSRIDGSMKFEDRQQQIEEFNSDPDVPIFLLSTRAGGLGLNLTAADTVIIYDSDWNPQQDLQAQDRCHRIGQTKPVVVYRILTANTVDQRIVERAREKRTLEKMVIHKERFKGRRDEKKLTSSELKELLQSPDHMTEINSEDISDNRVLSTEQLKKLLDRSDLLSDATTVSENTDEENKLFKVMGIDE